MAKAVEYDKRWTEKTGTQHFVIIDGKEYGPYETYMLAQDDALKVLKGTYEAPAKPKKPAKSKGGKK